MRLLLSLLLFMASAQAALAEDAELSPEIQKRIKRGEYLFRGACGGYCHGTDDGERDAPYLFDCTWLHGGSDDEIFSVIYNGVNGTRMNGFGDRLPAKEDDIRSIIEFLKHNRKC